MGRKRDGSGEERGGSCFITDVLAYCSRKKVLKCNLFLLTEISGMGWREGEMCGGGRGGSCYITDVVANCCRKNSGFCATS